MISSFRCRETAKVFARERSRKFSGIERAALVKLPLLEGADRLDDLRVPPGNRLEKLSGDRQGQWTIRINSQWRICFRWNGTSADDVEIVDYTLMV